MIEKPQARGPFRHILFRRGRPPIFLPLTDISPLSRHVLSSLLASRSSPIPGCRPGAGPSFLTGTTLSNVNLQASDSLRHVRITVVAGDSAARRLTMVKRYIVAESGPLWRAAG